MERVAVIRSLFDTSGKGLEIGPSYNPILPKSEGFEIDIVDHISASDLRLKYMNEQGVDVSLIEEVDFIWDGRPLSEVIGKSSYYDYIVASHVIEHTPDFLGFLVECEILLKQNGTLVFAVPDKRRCFDVFRPLSTTGGVLQAHLEKRTRHIPATAFDHVAYFATMRGDGGCDADTYRDLRLEHSLAFSQNIFHRSVISQDYFDFHAWTFTPSSFRMILKDLYAVDQLKLQEREFRAAAHEFFITLSCSAKGCGLSREELLYQTQREISELRCEQPRPVITSITRPQAGDPAGSQLKGQDPIEILRSVLGCRGPGLEIGPLHRSAAPKRDKYQVEILDHASAEALRAKYGKDPNVDVSLIEEVDYVSDGGSMLDTIGQLGKYEWIIASHVIEHTTDMLGFLLDCQALLRPDGRLVLAVPNRRFCFDALRPLTTVGQILQAHLDKRSRHLPGTIYDFVSEYSARDSCGAWGEGHPGQLVRGHSDAAAWQSFQATSETADYIDAHAWVFVPASFRLLVETMYGLGLLKLREASYHPTIGCEFFVVLSEQGTGPGMSTDALRRASEEEQLAGLLERFNLLPSRPGSDAADAPGGEAVGDLVVNQLRAVYTSKVEREERIQRLESLLAHCNDASQHARQQSEDAQGRIAALEAQIAAYQESTSWRLTAPARAIAEFMGVRRDRASEILRRKEM
jgi:2-polyprenyl-3-methyl-5-hydroxy-6-metoxy-1,4-benzoquinol methylase